LIHITDGKTDRILDVIDEEEFWEDKHTKSLKDTLETFDFTTFADKRFSEHLAERNRVIIPDEDGEYIEFIIENTRKFHGADGLFIEVYTSASYIELAKAKVIDPQTTPAWTAKQHAEMALSDTEWTVGTVDFSGSRTITIESYTNPYSYLKQIANEFGLELHFRVETDSNKVTRRYVDLIERIGRWNGREVEFGKDLIGIERKEDFSNIVTALVGIGPERDDGTRLEVFVEDKDALARWGRNGKHIIDKYEPDSSDSNMTLEQLRSLTEAELAKRINSAIEYTGDVVDLEKVPGLEHEKFRFGDTIRIKDTAFNPPLYLEARIHTVERSIKQDGQKTVTLGDYIEYTEEDVFAIYKRLQAEIAKKVSLSQVMEVTYTKAEIDMKDTNVKNEAAQDATNKANAAEYNAKQYAESQAQQAEQNAKNYADQAAEQKANQVKSELEASIAEKADAEWVNGQLQTKADKANTYTKTEVDNALNSRVSVTQYTTDMTGVVIQLNDHESRITQTETEIVSKVSETTYQQDKAVIEGDISDLQTRMTNAETSIIQNAQQIALKANQSEVDTLTGRVSNAESQISVLSDEIDLKVDKNGVISAINLSSEQARILAEKILLDGYVEAKHIKSLNGLNINDKFIVDQNGNVTFAGTLIGATGTFTGSVIVSDSYVGEFGHLITETVTIEDGSLSARHHIDSPGYYTIDTEVKLTSGGISITYADAGYELDGSTTASIYNDAGNLIIENSLGSGVSVYADDIHLTGLTWTNDIMIRTAYGIRSEYGNNHIIKDHANGNITMSAAGGDLYLGYANTNYIRSQKEHWMMAGARVKAGSMIVEAGNLDAANGIVLGGAFRFTSISSTPASGEGVLWYGNGFNGKGLYLHVGTGWTFIGP
jgi:phage minor structural protein